MALTPLRIVPLSICSLESNLDLAALFADFPSELEKNVNERDGSKSQEDGKDDNHYNVNPTVFTLFFYNSSYFSHFCRLVQIFHRTAIVLEEAKGE